MQPLLVFAAAVECLVGIALVALPAFTVSVLLGIEPHEDGLMLARIAGVALFALGVACWGARAGSGDPASTGTLNAITIYNAGAGLLLVAYVAMGMAGGAITLLVGILHLTVAAAFAIARWNSRRAERAN
jgi:hypothetical protein